MKLNSRFFFALAVATVAAPALHAQSPRAVPAIQPQVPTPVAVPFYLPIEQFGQNGSSHVSNAAALTAAEEIQLLAAISSMERFPAYYYSGCHDRAQAAYMMLPASLRPKMKKIWILSPGRYTAAIGRTLGLRRQDAASREVKWGYHVALAWEGPSGLRVFDPILKPGEAITREQWFGMLNIPVMSLWMVSRGDLYNFNFTDVYPNPNRVNIVWNGDAFNYDGGAFSNRWVPKNLARDAIGVDAMAGRACPQINDLATKPEDLFNLLTGPPQNIGAACQASVARFGAEVQRWSTRLNN